MTGKRYEVHTHAFVTGPRARSRHRDVEHSHEDGDSPHSHPETGPALFTIDKDEWFMATGLRGYGRKRFTKQPTGEQLAYVAPTPEQLTFRVVLDPTYTAEHARAGITEAQFARDIARFRAAAGGDIPPMQPGVPGDGGAAVANVALSFGMTPIYEVEP